MYSKAKRVLAVAAETTPGTAVAPGISGADWQGREVDWTPNVESEEDKVATGDHGENEAIPGVQTVEFKAKTLLKASSAVNIAPDWSVMIEACGLKRTAHGVTGISWAHHTDNDIKCLTMWGLHTEGGAAAQQLSVAGRGGMGAPKLMSDGRGKPIKWDLAYKAAWYQNTDIVNASILGILTPYAQLPEKFLNSTVTVNGVTCRADKFEMDWGIVVEPVPDQSNGTGILHFYLKEPKPRFKIAVELPRVATDNYRNRITGTTVGTVSVAISSNFTFKIPRAQLVDAKHIDIGGVEYLDCTYRCLRNGTVDATMDPQTVAELLYGSKT